MKVLKRIPTRVEPCTDEARGRLISIMLSFATTVMVASATWLPESSAAACPTAAVRRGLHEAARG